LDSPQPIGCPFLFDAPFFPLAEPGFPISARCPVQCSLAAVGFSDIALPSLNPLSSIRPLRAFPSFPKLPTLKLFRCVSLSRAGWLPALDGLFGLESDMHPCSNRVFSAILFFLRFQEGDSPLQIRILSIVATFRYLLNFSPGSAALPTRPFCFWCFFGDGLVSLAYSLPCMREALSFLSTCSLVLTLLL